jgi:HAD superfamily hydrolase (TIGR01490 family)
MAAGTAIFDMDRTLTREGTWSRYMMGVNRNRPQFWMSLPAMGGLAGAYKLGLLPRKAVKERGLATLRWATRAQLEAAADVFADEEVETGLRLRTKDVLARHKANGDRLVMATAAARLVAEPIAERLGFDEVIATELEWGVDERLTGRLLGENCYAEEKLKRVEAACAASKWAKPHTFYSDHVSDLCVLLWADKGIAVNPSAALERVAPENNVEIENWDVAV